MSFNLQSLFDKLNPVCRNSLENAAQLCLAQTNYNVEIEHYLLKLIEETDSDILLVFRYYDIQPSKLNGELTRAIDRFKRGNNRTPAMTPNVLRLLEQAWLLSSLYFNAGTVRSGAVLLALLDNDILRGVILESAPTLKRIPRDSIKQDMPELIQNSGEVGTSATQFNEETVSISSQTPALDQYTIDLTGRAKSGQIDAIRGRDAEIRQVIDILSRRRQNNPILCGEAGVGKTAVVEGFALRIVSGNVPPSIRSISLRLLDLALLQAGAGIKGEFEKRLKSVINEVKSATRPIILFIDEAHTMIGAGGPAGMGDAANLLKPALARGELRTIAATTWSEYKKYIEKDPALARRFQVVKINEPDEASAVEMLRSIAVKLQEHHNVTILDEAVQEAVRLSNRHITGRLLPDKAISVLDTACARVSVSQNGVPPQMEDAINLMEQVELEISILKREESTGVVHSDRIKALSTDLAAIKKERETIEKQWNEERDAVKRTLKIQKSIEELTQDTKGKHGRDVERLKKELTKEKARMIDIQGTTPMVPAFVDSGAIATVVSNWTGIPVGKMLSDEIETVLSLKDKMAKRIIGQDQALDVIYRRIRTYRAGLDDPGKPVGVFLLVGPSGIGKTETAVTLADLLYGGDRNIIVVNMSEYQEAYTVSGLKGAPPGYVGYGKGGVLTEAVRQNPYSLVLLDEVEKAHPDVMELFYQVFDKGTLEDSEGLTVDFKNTMILLTSNIGSEAIIQICRDGENLPDTEAILERIRPNLLKYFKPAFLGRLVIVPYYPLSDDVIRNIVRLKLVRIQERFRLNHKAEFIYSEDLVAAVAARCTEVDTGARNVDHILTQILLPDLSKELLKRMAVGEACTGIYAYLNAAGEFAYRFEPPLTAADLSLSTGRMEGPLDWSTPKHFPSDIRTKPAGTIFDHKEGGQGRSRIRTNRKIPVSKTKGWLNLFKLPPS
jgi:type VI secretion system protein VasG